MSARDKGIPTKDSVSLLPCFYFVELPILVSSLVSLYFLEWTDVFKPVKSGFNCHDRSLSLPYIDPNREVIPLLMLLSLAFAGPAITIMIGEAIVFCCLSRKRRGGGVEANINAAGCNFNSFIRRAVRFVGVHAFGLCATALITDILQLMTGYPTPYFLTVCKPNYTTLNVSCEQNPYILEDICSGADPAAIIQGRKSFPSQHATLASFAAVYVSMYFNSTLTDSSKLLKPLLVFSFIICAIICGLTRIIQYKNHAIDVYLGFLLGGAIAVYLGLYAVGNFQPNEEASASPPPMIHRPPCSLPHISQEAILHHLQMKASMAGEPGMPTSHSEGLLHRGLPLQRPEDCLQRSSADVEVISPRSPHSKDAIVTFSHTLPRVHTPQAMAAYEEAARRHAATLHHASMDSSRITGGARISMQSRPGSSQLVHIPEEAHENYNPNSPRTGGGGGGSEVMSTINSTVQANWQRAAEKTAACRTNDSNSQPRLMQVIALSKQQGLLQTHSKSLDEGSMGCSATGGCQGSGRYRALTDQDAASTTGPSPLGSTTGSISGSTGAIVRVEAHPENNRPVIQAPSTDGSGSWRWRSLDHGTGASGAGGGVGSLKQSFELNDLNRDSESPDSTREGSIDRKRGNHIVTTTATVSNPPIVTVHTQNNGQSEHRHHPQGLSTIRVTPGDGGGSGSGGGGGGEGASETPSVASSRESTLRRKGNSIILIPERTNSPDNARNVFYKGTSITPVFKE
ncbi:phospholipid phosphatase-related protein type 4 [Etheostoma cragini]|uniref:phospholipid phosphatase-related protein type 4 n=1 Tax=Etheostoma cragini TaxID=417921 RepID=UPI00155DF6BB|nr:phospholipid phosphatase-related protein type 4 [Etheostoma cragini]